MQSKRTTEFTAWELRLAAKQALTIALASPELEVQEQMLKLAGNLVAEAGSLEAKGPETV